MKPRTESDPFISLNLRAFIEAKDPFEQAAVTALVFWHWWQGNNEGLGVEGLAALGKMSAGKAKIVATELKARGWIETSRSFGGKTKYRLTVEKMTFKEAYALASNWLPHSQMAPSQLATTEPSISYDIADIQLPHSQPNSKRLDLSQTKEKDLPAVAGIGKHPDEKKFWDSAKEIWSKRFPDQILLWPGSKGSAPIKDFQKLLTENLEARGADNLLKRWFNCVNATYGQPSMRNFIYDTDKWVKDSNASKGGREFNQPSKASDWTPTQRDI